MLEKIFSSVKPRRRVIARTRGIIFASILSREDGFGKSQHIRQLHCPIVAFSRYRVLSSFHSVVLAFFHPRVLAIDEWPASKNHLLRKCAPEIDL